MTTDAPVGLSVWEERLYRHLTGHIATEANAMAGHGALMERSTGWVRFVLQLIGEDEARHHALFERWAASVAAMGELREADDGIPFIRPVDDPAELRAALEELLAIERADEHDLRALHKELRDVKDTTLWDLLVDLMLLDTQKHQRMLSFVLNHLD